MAETNTPDAQTNDVIRVRDLVTHYGTRQILNGINMEVREGEIMVIPGACAVLSKSYRLSRYYEKNN